MSWTNRVDSGLELAERATLAIEQHLATIETLLEQLVRHNQDRSRNFLAEGALPGAFPVTTQSQQILQANPRRRGSLWTNISAAATVSLGLGTLAAANVGVVLPPGASWDGTISGMTWQGSVQAIGSAAATLAYVET